MIAAFARAARVLVSSPSGARYLAAAQEGRGFHPDALVALR